MLYVRQQETHVSVSPLMLVSLSVSPLLYISSLIGTVELGQQMR